MTGTVSASRVAITLLLLCPAFLFYALDHRSDQNHDLITIGRGKGRGSYLVESRYGTVRFVSSNIPLTSKFGSWSKTTFPLQLHNKLNGRNRVPVRLSGITIDYGIAALISMIVGSLASILFWIAALRRRKENYVPSQGDIVILTFDPQAGHEQKGRRPALVVSVDSFNRATGMALCCPITNTNRKAPFHVPVPENSELTGFVMCEQMKSIDYRARKIKKVGGTPKEFFTEVLSVIDACIYS